MLNLLEPRMISHNPLGYAAREALSMGKDADCKAFRTVALCLMGVSALAMTSQVMLSLWKELNRQDRRRTR